MPNKNHASKLIKLLISCISLDRYRRALNNDNYNESLEKMNKVRNDIIQLNNEQVKAKNLALENKQDQQLALSRKSIEIIDIQNKNKAEIDKLSQNNEKLNNPELSEELKTLVANDIKNSSKAILANTKKEITILEDIKKILDDDSSKGSGSGGTTNYWGEEIITKINDTLATATTTELGAIGHLTAALFILSCLITITISYSGNYLIEFFKLETRYPRFAFYIRWRVKFQNFYFFSNVLFILFMLLFVIYINICVLLKI